MKQKKSLREPGNDFADFIGTPKIRAVLLIQLALAMSLSPPDSPRSASRDKSDRTIARHKAIRAGTWAAKYPFMQDETIDPIIRKAFVEGNAAEVLAAISKGVEHAENPPELSSFARHVIVSARQAAHIMSEENRIPSKAEVRGAVEAVFKQSGWFDFQCDPQRWTEIFKSATLDDLPRGKASHT